MEVLSHGIAMMWHPSSNSHWVKLLKKSHYIKAGRLEEIHKMLEWSQICRNMNHLREVINKREDKQKVIRASQERRNISYLCAGFRISLRDLQITAKRKNTHGQRKQKKAKEPQTQADQQTWGRLYVYDPALPPRSLLHTHTHTQSTQKRAHTLRTTHCLADLFKSQELCLSFPTSCSQKYLWASSVVFFCVFCMHMYI